MEIRYDKEADALYIEFRKGKFAKNRKIDDFTIIDLDAEGNMLGIELLEVSKRIKKSEKQIKKGQYTEANTKMSVEEIDNLLLS